MEEAFAAFDEDRLGYLTSEQKMTALMRGDKGKGKGKEEAEAKAAELMATYDEDGDGLMQYGEFAKVYQSQRYAWLEAPNDLLAPVGAAAWRC